MAESETRVLTEIAIAAPIETVWQAVRDTSIIGNWFGWDADTLPDEIDFIFRDHSTPAAGDRRLDFGEWEGSSYSFELVPKDDGTLMRILWTSAAFRPDFDAAYDDVAEGWLSFSAQLRLLLEYHQGETRRTIFLSTKFVGEEKSLSTALNVHGLRDARPESPFMANLPMGELIEGTFWHRSRHQLGMLVPAWGDGLLIVTDRPASEGAIHGGGSVLITTFGLGDAQFTAMKSIWDRWWAERYPAA